MHHFNSPCPTRAGTDCVGHAVRAMTDLNPRTTVLSIDGVGAYDHVFRSSMLSKLYEVESLRGLLPFVRGVHSQPSTYYWQDRGWGAACDPTVRGWRTGRPPHVPFVLFGSARRSRSNEGTVARWGSSSRSSTTCMRCAPQNGPGTSTICSRRSCSWWQASGCTRGRRARGTKPVKCPIEWRSWARQCGAPQGRRFWVHRWALMNSIRKQRGAVGRGEPSCGGAIPSVPDLQCAWQLLVSVPALIATISSAMSRPSILRCTHRVMTEA